MLPFIVSVKIVESFEAVRVRCNVKLMSDGYLSKVDDDVGENIIVEEPVNQPATQGFLFPFYTLYRPFRTIPFIVEYRTYKSLFVVLMGHPFPQSD